MFSLTNLNLQKKIILLTGLGLALGAAIFSSLGLRAVNQATQTMLEDRLTTANLLKDYLDETLGLALSELQHTAAAIGENKDPSSLELHTAALENIYTRFSLFSNGVFLFESSGEIIWSKPEIIPDEFNPSSYLDINQALTSSKAIVSGLVSVPFSNGPVVFLMTPTQSTGTSDSVLAIAIDITRSSIGGFINPIRLGKTGYVEIVDENGLVVTRTSPGPALAPFEQSDHSGRFAALIAAGKPTVGGCHTCHNSNQVEKRDVLAFVPLSEARWGVVIRQSETEAMAPARQLRMSLIFFGVGLVIVLLFIIVLFTRDVGHRMETLSSASRRIAAGDLATPVRVVGKDEVSQLAHSLDGMRVQLKTSYGELEHKTNELASLLSVSEILTSSSDLPNIFNAVLAKAVEVIPGTDGGALLLENNEGITTVQSALGVNAQILAKLTGQLQSEDGIKSLISAQVLHRNRPVGHLIMLSYHDAQAFSESDRRLIRAIADYVAIALERHELSKKEEESRALLEADRLRSHFISSVSHELRTPLTLIKGYSTSLLRQDVSWDEKSQREFLQIIDDKTDELRELIDKLLQSAKMEAGVLKLNKEPLLMPRLVHKIIEELKPRARNHSFELKFSPAFPVIEADIRCIEQTVRNLVENSIKYSPEGSNITVTGDVNDNSVLICVADEGMGIPSEHRDKIFERFYRVAGPTTQGIGGSGLGLFICKGHVEAHDGKIWVESTPGKGSRFCFTLPFNQGEYQD